MLKDDLATIQENEPAIHSALMKDRRATRRFVIQTGAILLGAVIAAAVALVVGLNQGGLATIVDGVSTGIQRLLGKAALEPRKSR